MHVQYLNGGLENVKQFFSFSNNIPTRLKIYIRWVMLSYVYKISPDDNTSEDGICTLDSKSQVVFSTRS
jgi:hypothetical protein